jgi:hypothetical protein
MASDTATATGSVTVATGDGGRFAEPAEILTRLTPDDLHPARLAGLHAWHPWGLTQKAPTDHHLRLTLPKTFRTDAAEQLLDRLEHQLTRTPWPPIATLDVHRTATRLDCRDQDARQSTIDVTIAPHETRGRAEVVTRDGWLILDELAALNDRIGCIDIEQPAPTDLADLASWVEHKMAGPASNNRFTAPLPQLLSEQARNHPSAAERLRTSLTRRTIELASERPARVLAYLAEQLDHHQRPSHTRTR